MPGNTNEIVAGRDVLAYTEPWLAANTLPATGAWGTAPGGSWTDLGYTKDGLHTSWRMTFQEYTVDQFLDPVARIPSTRDLRLRANLGQYDSANMVIASGQGTSAAVAAASGTRGSNTFTLTSTLANLYYSTFYDCRSPVSGEAAQVVGWKGRAVGDVTLDFHISDIAQLNLEHALIPDDSVTPARIAVIRIITPALP